MTAQEFNQRYGVGTSVNYHPIIGEPEHVKTRTRTPAEDSASGYPVVWIEGEAGYVVLEAISIDPLVEKYSELGRKAISHGFSCLCESCMEFMNVGDEVHRLGLQA
jgi:hypothetical protein